MRARKTRAASFMLAELSRNETTYRCRRRDEAAFPPGSSFACARIAPAREKMSKQLWAEKRDYLRHLFCIRKKFLFTNDIFSDTSEKYLVKIILELEIVKETYLKLLRSSCTNND